MSSTAPSHGDALTSLLYRSAAVRPFGPDDLYLLEEKATRTNQQADISGYLTYRSGSFTQYLEGPTEVVVALYESIASDSRHKIGTTVFLAVEERRFPTWSMRLLDPLWHPTGEALDAIDELLLVPETRPDDPIVSAALDDLLGQVMLTG